MSSDEPSHERMVFANRVKEIRERQGLTQRELARIAGMKQPYIAAIETGERNPTLESMVKIAAALGVPVRSLFYERRGDD